MTSKPLLAVLFLVSLTRGQAALAEWWSCSNPHGIQFDYDSASRTLNIPFQLKAPVVGNFVMVVAENSQGDLFARSSLSSLDVVGCEQNLTDIVWTADSGDYRLQVVTHCPGRARLTIYDMAATCVRH